jgi:hypothetical protein
VLGVLRGRRECNDRWGVDEVLLSTKRRARGLVIWRVSIAMSLDEQRMVEKRTDDDEGMQRCSRLSPDGTQPTCKRDCSSELEDFLHNEAGL